MATFRKVNYMDSAEQLTSGRTGAIAVRCGETVCGVMHQEILRFADKWSTNWSPVIFGGLYAKWLSKQWANEHLSLFSSICRGVVIPSPNRRVTQGEIISFTAISVFAFSSRVRDAGCSVRWQMMAIVRFYLCAHIAPANCQTTEADSSRPNAN